MQMHFSKKLMKRLESPKNHEEMERRRFGLLLSLKNPRIEIEREKRVSKKKVTKMRRKGFYMRRWLG